MKPGVTHSRVYGMVCFCGMVCLCGMVLPAQTKIKCQKVRFLPLTKRPGIKDTGEERRAIQTRGHRRVQRLQQPVSSSSQTHRSLANNALTNLPGGGFDKLNALPGQQASDSPIITRSMRHLQPRKSDESIETSAR